MPRSDFPLPDIAATQTLARHIAPYLRKADILALTGDLGAGKTEFARALLYALGVTGDVPSPTFTLLQTYEVNGLLISHFDLYRLQSPNELDELGWDDALADGLTIAEWPERAGSRLPSGALSLHFTINTDGTRLCRLQKNGAWRDRL